MDRDSREIVGVFIGSLDKSGALGLWDSLPAEYRENAVCYTPLTLVFRRSLKGWPHRNWSRGGFTGLFDPLQIRRRILEIARQRIYEDIIR